MANNVEPLYGICSTPATVAEKIVVCAAFDHLFNGAIIRVKFDDSNGILTPTMNVNSTGARAIQRYTPDPDHPLITWTPGAVVEFMYVGSASNGQWNMMRIMAQHLIPVKTGNEQFPVSYRTYLPAIQNYQSFVSTISHHMLYIATYVQAMDANEYALYVYTLNLVTWAMELVGVIPRSSIGNSLVGSILVDDEFLYVASGTTATIYIFNVDTLAFVTSTNYSSNAFRAYGKMQWLDEHTICTAFSNGLLFFDTTSRTFTFKQGSLSYNLSDICAGSTAIIMNQADYPYNTIITYNKTTETFSTITLPTSNIAVSAYENGKFYVANTSKLYVIDEATLTIERTIDASWGATRSISITNGSIFVSCTSSPNIYIYDMTSGWKWFIIAPWTIPGWSGTNIFIPNAAYNWFFYPFRTLCQMDYSGQSKYNFGPKALSVSVLFNESNKSHFTYDERFVEFTDTYVMVKDGSYDVPLQTIDEVNHIKSATIHKSDYNILKKLSLIQSIE